jgi:hypothetical protein
LLASGSLDGYRLSAESITKPDPLRGTPELRYGVDRDGRRALVRTWHRASAEADSDLLPFWHYELRLLAGLHAITKDLDVFAPQAKSGADDAGYHLSSLIESRRLLADWFADSGSWRPPRADNERSLCWRNLGRLAQALSILHEQGITHRNLDEWSVLTENGATADFQLVGFEWSTRIATSGLEATENRPSTAFVSEYGFSRDWRDLGRLALRLFDIPEARLLDYTVADKDVISTTPSAEIALLRTLYSPARQDSTKLVHGLAAIASELELKAQRRKSDLSLFLPLGEDNVLTRSIQFLSHGEATIADVEAQRRFVEQDLAENAQALAISNKDGGDFDVLLKGHLLYYVARDYFNSAGSTNWALAYCRKALSIMDRIPTPLNRVSVGQLSVKVIVETDPPNPQFMQESGAWQSLRARLDPRQEEDASQQPFAQSLLLIQVVQGCIAASAEFPVETVPAPPRFRGVRSGQHALHVRARRDVQREKLSALLGYRGELPQRLNDILTGESSGSVETWHLVRPGDEIDPDEGETKWEFQRATPTGHGQTYTFVGNDAPPRSKRAFLVPADALGSYRQFRRQMTAWRAMCDQGELLDLLRQPRRAIKHVQIPLVEDDRFSELDPDKQQVLREVVSTRPLFLVQGPPGVGKTHLVSELARQLLHKAPPTRMLFAAQSHAAVDHLLKDVADALKGKQTDRKPLIVRCRAQESERRPTAFDASLKAAEFAEQISKSPHFDQISPHLRRQVQEVGQAPFYSHRSGLWAARRTTSRPIESLILRSANLVFGTTNAASLEHLLSDQAHFDWTVIEEAAKATGTELLNALLLAPRRLMIGDQRQLPPFDAKRLMDVLSNPLELTKLLWVAGGLGGRHFYDADIRGLLRAFNSNDDSIKDAELAQLSHLARRSSLLFENLFNEQRDPSAGSPTLNRFTRMLTYQHRMHPAIARVVSHTFYRDTLQSATTCVEHYQTHNSPIRTHHPAQIPIEPIVWVETPWIQERAGHSFGEKRPGPHNPAEVAVVVEILSALEPIAQARKKPVSLAILSPYRAQVQAIQKAIDRSSPTLRTRLQLFATVADQRVHTVDSFQGNQADIVIVSLVRNNHRGSLIGALGFLGDERRMNVLFSRARWQLIIVGSWRLLEDVVERLAGTPEEASAAFLARLLEGIQRETQSSLAQRVSGISLLPGNRSRTRR